MSHRINFPEPGFMTAQKSGEFQMMCVLQDGEKEGFEAIFKVKISSVVQKGEYPELGWIGIPKVNNQSCAAMISATAIWLEKTEYYQLFKPIITDKIREVFAKTEG